MCTLCLCVKDQDTGPSPVTLWDHFGKEDGSCPNKGPGTKLCDIQQNKTKKTSGKGVCTGVDGRVGLGEPRPTEGSRLQASPHVSQGQGEGL